jgi:hypothetical protein
VQHVRRGHPDGVHVRCGDGLAPVLDGAFETEVRHGPAPTVGVDVGQFSLALKFTGTDYSGANKVTDDVFNNEGRVLFSVSTTLPWGE